MGIVSDALALEGKITYVYGGNKIYPGGAGDCSAFTQKIFRDYGYEIGRSSGDQFAKGTPVDYEDLKPGDLVFFAGTDPDRGNGISHVGLYVGKGNMVNLQLRGVVVEPVLADWWKDYYAGARRIADPDDVGSIYDLPSDGGSVSGSTILTGSGWGLDWWGDIAAIVLIIGCILAGIFFCYKAFAAQLSGLLPSVDDIGAAVEKIKPAGGVE